MARGADDEAVAELYLGDFDDFVGRRNELAKQLDAEGSCEAGKRVRALKKPSRVAWALNQFSGGEAKLRDELLDAGAALREAQERLVAGEAGSADLREAGAREREAVSSALAAVDALAGAAEAHLSGPAVERARQTLHAVALDEEVRRDFEGHRLTVDHDAPGLGELSLGASPGAGKGARRTPSKKDKEREQAQRRLGELKALEAEAGKLAASEEQAERALQAAREAAEQAQRDLQRATKEQDKAAKASAAAQRRVDELSG